MKSVVFVILFILLGGVLFAPLSIDSYELTPSELKLGQEGSIKIVLKNIQLTGVTTASQVDDITVYYNSIEGIDVRVDQPIRVGTIESGSSAIVTVPIRVLPNAKAGIIPVSFSIKQKDGDTQNLIVPVKISNPPILTLSLDKQTISSTDTLNVTITNNGGNVNKLIVRLNNTEKFSFVGTDQIYVGGINGSKTFKIAIDSRNADEGVNTIPLLLAYEEEGGDSASEAKNIAITVKKEKADVIFSQEAQIVTSIDNVLKLKVRNIGRSLNDFRVILEDDNIKAKETKEIKLGDFAADDEKIIDIRVFADTEPGVRNTNIKLKWVEEDVEKEEKITIPIVVSSDADVGIFLDSKPAPLVPTGEHTLSVTVSNIGSYRIENVEVALQENDILEVLNAQRSQYIGGLENDAFSAVQYKIRIKNIQPGTHTLPIFVRYKDQSGIWIEKNITSSVVIRPFEESGKKGGSTLPYIVGAALLLLSIYWYFRRKKKQVV
ncbi:hypothetical protein J4450_06835 [Candidatus Micrarchaeota archaeon]|nr:hypothetical protein [Candidatus Micrarchaeota archaeon]